MTETKTSIKKRNYEAMAEVEISARSAADVLRLCLQTADRKSYVRFLDVMYHYTRFSGPKCAMAARRIKELEVKALFIEFDQEEANHYKLAQNDLAAFGKTPSIENPTIVQAIDRFWESLEHKHYNGYLGILYVFENIAKYLQNDIADFIKRLELTKPESSWLRAHAEEDLEHGKVVVDMLNKHIEEDPEVAIYAAKQASSLWSAMMLYAFDTGYETPVKMAA